MASLGIRVSTNGLPRVPCPKQRFSSSFSPPSWRKRYFRRTQEGSLCMQGAPILGACLFLQSLNIVWLASASYSIHSVIASSGSHYVVTPTLGPQNSKSALRFKEGFNPCSNEHQLKKNLEEADKHRLHFCKEIHLNGLWLVYEAVGCIIGMDPTKPSIHGMEAFCFPLLTEAHWFLGIGDLEEWRKGTLSLSVGMFVCIPDASRDPQGTYGGNNKGNMKKWVMSTNAIKKNKLYSGAQDGDCVYQRSLQPLFVQQCNPATCLGIFILGLSTFR